MIQFESPLVEQVFLGETDEAVGLHELSDVEGDEKEAIEARIRACSPGEMRVTRTGVGISSMRRELVYPWTACLLALRKREMGRRFLYCFSSLSW